MTGGIHVLVAVGGGELGEGIGGVGRLGVGGHGDEGVGVAARHVVGLILFKGGIGGVADAEGGGAGHDIAGQDGFDGGGDFALQEQVAGAGAVGLVHGLGVPDTGGRGVHFVMQRLGKQGIVKVAQTFGVVEYVLALGLTDGVGPVVDLVEVAAAVDQHLAVRVALGQLFAGSQILIPGPGGGQLAQTGSFPLVQVDGHVDGQAAGGEHIGAALILIGVGAPVFHQVQTIRRQAVSQVHQQAVLPALGGVGHAEAQQHVHLAAGDDGGIQAHVAVGAVLVHFVVDLHVGVELVELGDQGVRAVGAGKGGVEGDLARQFGVRRFGQGQGAACQHHEGQQDGSQLFHWVTSLFFVTFLFHIKGENVRGGAAVIRAFPFALIC